MKNRRTEMKKRIHDLRELSRAAMRRQAVVCPDSRSFCQPVSAAFVLSMQARIVLGLISMGMYVYSKEMRDES